MDVKKIKMCNHKDGVKCPLCELGFPRKELVAVTHNGQTILYDPKLAEKLGLLTTDEKENKS